MTMRLEVFMGRRRVGWLEHDAGSNQFSFAYAPEWLEDLESFPLAPSLPLIDTATSDAHNRAVRVFFENLLPEGEALDEVARLHGVSKFNVAGLLSAIGRETAGALRIVATGPGDETPRTLRPVRPLELSQRIQERQSKPFSIWDSKVRLSIAGYQDKIAVFQDNGGGWHLIDGDAPEADLSSTHILKPEPRNPRMEGLTSNEFFCMRLAQAVKLAVAPVTLHHVPEPVLSIERFDRRRIDTGIERLAVIDGCQALGLSVTAKYERLYGDGRDVRDIRSGASLPMLFRLLDTSARPVAERQKLLRWTLFQVLIGNTDAHAKNLTFYTGPGGLELAPAYDLVCSAIYADNQVEDTYAMAIGDAFTATELTAYEWAHFASLTKTSAKLLQRELKAMAKQLSEVLGLVQEAVVLDGAEPETVDRVANYAREQCARMSAVTDIVSMQSYF